MESSQETTPESSGADTSRRRSASASAATSPNERQPKKGCSLLPHGGYTLIPATLSTMGWIASLAQDGCDYSQLTGPTVDDLTGGSSSVIVGGVPYLEVGFNAYRAPQYWPNDNEWRVDYASTCTEYDPVIVTMDLYWKMGKAFEFFSLVLGGGGALFLWFSSCFVFSPATWRWAGYEVAAAAIFQAMAFIWFRTAMCQMDGNNCALFFGSKADIAAAMFWLTSAVAIFCRYPAPQPKEGQQGTGDQQGDVEMSGAGGGGNVGDDDIEVEDLQFENDEEPKNELPLVGDSKAKMSQGCNDPEVEVPAHDADHEII